MHCAAHWIPNLGIITCGPIPHLRSVGILAGLCISSVGVIRCGTRIAGRGARLLGLIFLCKSKKNVNISFRFQTENLVYSRVQGTPSCKIYRVSQKLAQDF